MPVVCPSVRLSFRPSVTPSVRQTTENTDAIDFGPCAKTKMAAIELFNMYAIDTPFERDIFRTV